MSVATTSSQGYEKAQSKQSVFQMWFNPRSKDRDEAFRERTIRISIGLVVILGLLSFMLTVFVYNNKWDVISLPTLHVFVLLGFAFSAYMVSQELILPAAWCIVITSLIAVSGIVILDNQAFGSLVDGIPLNIVVILLAALVLPRSSIWIISIMTVLAYGMAMFISQQSLGDRTPYNLSQVILVAVIIMPTVGAILYRLRVEFDGRLEAMHQSIQEAIEARQQAEQSRQRAEDADKAKSQFLANMSHELRTPLNAIIGYDEAMIGGMVGEFTQQQTKLLGHIQHNSRRLLGLINDILDLSKVESGSLQVFLAPMSPQKVIQETVESVRSLADEKKIYLNMHFSEAVPAIVLGDSKKLQQVLVNILSNAIKFTDDGGVTVDVDILDASRWQFRVVDTGIGMPSDAASYIFEPFQQVDGTDKRKYKGTGLGLAITKRLVERLGGSIAMTSELGKGSTFTIILPRAHVPGENVKLENA